jgi:hypothetical protein
MHEGRGMCEEITTGEKEETKAEGSRLQTEKSTTNGTIDFPLLAHNDLFWFR